MPPRVLLRAFPEVLFRIHMLQHATSLKDKNVIYLPNPFKLGTDRETLNRLFDRVVSEFKRGESTVVINVGNKLTREAKDVTSNRKTFGTHAIDFLCSNSTLTRFSSQTGKSIKAYEGIKPSGQSTLEFYEIGSEYSIGGEDSSYIALREA